MPEPRYRTAHLDDLEAIPGPGTLTWHPVRAQLGIRAFGTNAYTAAKAGDDVVEPHDENGAIGHQELYFVARGHARFTVAGDEIDAPAGTYVFIPDPGAHRHAVAREAGTTVLSFGGPPTFTPSAWEWSFRANALAAEDPERARAILADGFAVHPASPSLHYALARLDAREGDVEASLHALRRALELAPEAAGEARDEADLAVLRTDPRFRALLGL